MQNNEEAAKISLIYWIQNIQAIASVVLSETLFQDFNNIDKKISYI